MVLNCVAHRWIPWMHSFSVAVWRRVWTTAVPGPCGTRTSLVLVGPPPARMGGFDSLLLPCVATRSSSGCCRPHAESTLPASIYRSGSIHLTQPSKAKSLVCWRGRMQEGVCVSPLLKKVMELKAAEVWWPGARPVGNHSACCGRFLRWLQDGQGQCSHDCRSLLCP